MQHCENFDATYPGCRECPGKVNVQKADGSVDTICRANEYALLRVLDDRTALQENSLPRK